MNMPELKHCKEEMETVLSHESQIISVKDDVDVMTLKPRSLGI